MQEGELGASALHPIAQEHSSASAPTSGLIAQGLLCLVTVVAAEGPSLCPLQEGHQEAPGSFLMGFTAGVPALWWEQHTSERCKFFNENH